MNQRAEYAKHHQAVNLPLREGLPELPVRMRLLRVDARGYPVPWFVHWKADGTPDFRVIREGGVAIAHSKKLCWVCGQRLGANLAFVISPMCMINRTTSEPPSHVECAQFAVKACPFMILPAAKRREANLPADVSDPAGGHLDRNPGVISIWVTSAYRPFKAPGGYLIELGGPNQLAAGPDVSFYREGRAATRAEAYESIHSGMPFLIDSAKSQGVRALAELASLFQAALHFLPPGDPVPGLDIELETLPGLASP